MATKIKAVKCPQCGSEKHTQLDEKRFRCDSCGTEFYIDDDDININVNHRFDFGKQQPWSQQLGNIAKVGVAAFIVPLVLFVFIIGASLFSTSPKSTFSGPDSVGVYDHYEYIVPMKHAGKACFFYLVERNYHPDYRDDASKYTDGHYYGFRDAQTGEVLAEHLLFSESQIEELSDFSLFQSKMRYFHQARRWFMLIPKRFIYAVDPDGLTVRDVSKTMFAKKPAMSTGLSSAEFLDEDYGEGFEVINNLAEKYNYFPATGRLYTTEAFDYAKRLPPGELQGELRDSTYYKLQSKNNRIRICQLSFKFHLGDPQDAQYFSDDMAYQWDGDKRLSSAKPITDWFSGFNAKIVYQDSRYLLLSYNATIASDAPTVFQLRSTDGRLLWTKALDKEVETDFAVRADNRFWLKTETSYRRKDNEAAASSLSLGNGTYQEHYLFVSEYKIKAK